MTDVTDERSEATSATEQVKERVQDVTADAKHQTREQLRNQIETRSTEAGHQISAGGQAMRRTSEQLRSEGQHDVARFVEAVADRGEQLGAYLTRADGERILRDIEDFARRQPWLVAGGGAVLGFLGARFVKASSSGRYRARTLTVSSGANGAGFDRTYPTARPAAPAIKAGQGPGLG